MIHIALFGGGVLGVLHDENEKSAYAIHFYFVLYFFIICFIFYAEISFVSRHNQVVLIRSYLNVWVEIKIFWT